jgi:hypothetical protein
MSRSGNAKKPGGAGSGAKAKRQNVEASLI